MINFSVVTRSARGAVVAIAAVVAAASVAACASSGLQPETRQSTIDANSPSGTDLVRVQKTLIPTEEAVPVAPGRAWTVLPAVYDLLGIPVGTVDPANMLFGNQSLQARVRLGSVPISRYFSCGANSVTGIPNADNYAITIRVLTQLKPGPNGGTTVSTLADAYGRAQAFSSGDVPCGSTGVLEKQIVARIGELAAR